MSGFILGMQIEDRLHVRTRCSAAADDLQATRDDETKVDRSAFLDDVTDDDDPAARAQRAQRRVEGGGTDAIHDDVDWAGGQLLVKAVACIDDHSISVPDRRKSRSKARTAPERPTLIHLLKDPLPALPYPARQEKGKAHNQRPSSDGSKLQKAGKNAGKRRWKAINCARNTGSA